MHLTILYCQSIWTNAHYYALAWVILIISSRVIPAKKKKNIKMQRHLVIAFCAKLPDGHLKFDCSVLHSKVDFYFIFDEYSKLHFFTALLGTRGWTTSDFFKSTFMWWNSSRSWLVADDVFNEQISLELWQTTCAQLWNMTQCCPHDYCTYNSLFLSVL